MKTASLALVVSLLLLGGCADPDLTGLERELEALKRNPGELTVAPLPELPRYRAPGYEQADARSPFEARRPDDDSAAAPAEGERAPDPERPREPLERYDLSELELVGTLTVNAQPSALLRSPEGQVHRLRVGNYLGADDGRIVSITSASIVLVETVRERNAWVERTREMTLPN
ncbi:type IV pilus assembly protein PilP [Franzmannia pantelleriensis]|uniref:Type IV pilus assembly protein PilP n=1 Tax=Franzmannia pantelleriensis TaxID=48727 RepID=A0A1G9QBP8_9GAMM|nr:pilus assembly protein PilP [Halomonas pantelleriensis]SDM08350.1 type IV pilus assembly protein PilP [Halomonas pantelleriensis]